MTFFWVVAGSIVTALSVALILYLHRFGDNLRRNMLWVVGGSAGFLAVILAWYPARLLAGGAPAAATWGDLLAPLLLAAAHLAITCYLLPAVDPRLRRLKEMHEKEGVKGDAWGLSKTRAGAVTRIYIEQRQYHRRFCGGLAAGVAVAAYLVQML